MKTVEDAEKFLQSSQKELHESLSDLKSEYVTAIRRFAEAAKDKRFKALGDAIKHLDPHLEPQLFGEILGTWIFDPHEVQVRYSILFI